MARIKLQKIEPVEIEFADGTVKRAIFSNESSINYVSEFGRFPTEKELEDAPYDFMAKFLYCALKVQHPTTTLEEAQSIMTAGGGELMMAISEAMIINFIGNSNEETKKKFHQQMKEFWRPYLGGYLSKDPED